jgi:epoxyqueuosine reductase
LSRPVGEEYVAHSKLVVLSTRSNVSLPFIVAKSDFQGYEGSIPGMMLAEELSDLAYRNGAAGFGVTGAQVFSRERAALRTSRETDRSGPLRFTYDDPDVATDISLSFPWAKSLVVVSYDYLQQAETPADGGAVVGRFATTNHYAGVRRITGAIAEFLRACGHRAEMVSDDNRLVDRAAAVRAGVGWPGKSTMVLAPGHGPWMLLGTVVTDASIPVSRPMERDCGTCSACIPACPTEALGEEGLDARRCLSTWLQTPGSIPQWIRPLMGRRIYGCDDCLTACPPGRRALAAAGARPGEFPFADLLGLPDDVLLDRCSWWYVPRRQGRFIRRNVLVAAGNSREPEAREAVEAHTRHPSSMIRGHAYWAMARGFDGRRVLRDALETETVPEARDELLLALLMTEHAGAHAMVLEADERSRGNHSIRGLAMVGPHALAEGRSTDELELVFVGRDGREVGQIEAPMVRVYDPDRVLEARRRAALSPG